MLSVFGKEIQLYTQPMDMRRGIDGLLMIVTSQFRGEIQLENLYLFINRRLDKIKILYWDRNGFCLWHKRLEKGIFKVNFDSKEKTCLLTAAELRWLLDGLDYTKTQGHKNLNYETFF
jgi:transposase